MSAERIDFADPYKVCLTCKGWVTGVQAKHRTNIPCGHVGYESVCPSWGPMDGCSCMEHLGYVPHAHPDKP